ncbi:hypothetical protein CDAR_99041 [Caerostris darwini]|uniref:Anaphase-promoting complex subunit 1 n=1 Tax=Caerostris darwini TaxID=1538125 RepID=A0AAV4Q287_9ARAC|nr:hypothetical protein CDAR_99041 [Caerostris darwini]
MNLPVYDGLPLSSGEGLVVKLPDGLFVSCQANGWSVHAVQMRPSSAREWTALSSVVIGYLLQEELRRCGMTNPLIMGLILVRMGRPNPLMPINSPDTHAHLSTGVLLMHNPSPKRRLAIK